MITLKSLRARTVLNSTPVAVLDLLQSRKHQSLISCCDPALPVFGLPLDTGETTKSYGRVLNPESPSACDTYGLQTRINRNASKKDLNNNLELQKDDGQRRRRRCRETLRFVVMYFSLMHLTRLARMLSVYISGYVLFSFSFYSFISTIFSLMIDFSHLILQAVHGHYVCLGCTFASSYTLLCTYDPEDVIHASLFEYYPCLK